MTTRKTHHAAPRTLFLIIALLVTMLPATQLPRVAHASTLVVTNNNDSGPGSLRDTLASTFDGDIITFASPGTIVLTSGQLNIETRVSINGLGAGNTIIDGNNSSRVFNVEVGVVYFNDLTIQHGHVFGPGGGIQNTGAIVLSNSVVANNYGVPGGGIYNDTGKFDVYNSTIADNFSLTDGGGYFNEAGTGQIHGS